MNPSVSLILAKLLSPFIKSQSLRWERTVLGNTAKHHSFRCRVSGYHLRFQVRWLSFVVSVKVAKHDYITICSQPLKMHIRQMCLMFIYFNLTLTHQCRYNFTKILNVDLELTFKINVKHSLLRKGKKSDFAIPGKTVKPRILWSDS